MRNISAKLAVEIAVVLIVMMAAFGILENMQRRKQFMHFLDTKEESSLQALALMLGEFLFFMNLDPVKNIAAAYLSDQEIFAIKIMEGNEAILHTGKDPQTMIFTIFTRRQTVPEYANAVLREIPIVYQGDELGRLEMIFYDNLSGVRFNNL
jgi:hypothetical protein